MAPASQPELGSKERSLFAQVVKFYENKQYKKGLKAAEQILRKFPDHGDTIAMKALIINSQGNSEEAFALSKVAIKNSMKSHVCWHVYGLLWRSVKNFDEAIKAYKFALKLAPESAQIQKDLALLQIQMRDYPGYMLSRRSMLQQKTQWRQNWTALAIAQHLAGNLSDAERTLTTYEDIIKSPPPKTDIEHHEAVLYKNSIIAEMGETERALEHLNAATKINPDRGSVMELRARYLLELGKKDEAEKAFRDLLDRNAENRSYYDGLVASLGIDGSDCKALKELYDKYSEMNPRSDAPKRIPLDFLDGDDFRKAADIYLQQMLRKGVPSTFANLKSLYTDPNKQATIEKLVEGYATGKGVQQINGSAEKPDNKTDPFEPSVRYFLAQHYDYYRSRDLEKAIKYIDEAIESDTSSVDFHMTKARIWKHYGDTQNAADIMEKARTLDERDRYINTKAAKYRLRNNDNEAAIQDMKKFTRNEAIGGPLGDLHDMQCQWFIYEDGCAYLRQEKYGLALKRFSTIFNVFEIWQEDQFDFHSFSLRKGQIRAYVDMIRWEDQLRQHPFFTRAAVKAAGIYVKLHDRPQLAHGKLTNGIDVADMNPSERKKAQKKARKEAEKQAQKEAEKKDAKKTAGVDHNGDAKKEDPDPTGDKMLKTTEPLVEAMKFITPLLEFSPKSIEAQQAAFEVFIRRKKHLLALRALLATHSLYPSTSPPDPTLHHQTLHLLHLLSANASSTPLPPSTLNVLETTLPAILPSNSDLTLKSSPADLKAYNETYLSTNTRSALHVHAAIRVRRLLALSPPDSKGIDDDSLKALIATLEETSTTLDTAIAGLDLLKEWSVNRDGIEAYASKARGRWKAASAFKENV